MTYETQFPAYENFISLAADLARDISSADWAAILIRDRRTGDLVVHGGTAPFHEMRGYTLPVREFAGISSYVAINSKALIVQDVSQEPWRRWYHQTVSGVKSAMGIPLMLDELRLNGVLYVESRDLAKFDEEDLRNLAALGAVFTSVTDQLTAHHFYQNMSRAVIARRDRGEIFDLALDYVTRITGAHSVSVRELNKSNEMLEVRKRRGIQSGQSFRPIPLGGGIVGLTIKKLTFVMIDDVSDWGETYLEFNRSTRSELCVPILSQDGKSALGVMNLEHWEVGHFDLRDAQFVSDIAALVSAAMTTEHSIQDRLQHDQMAIGSEIAMGLAHPINSFLKAISGYLEILTSRIASDDEYGQKALAGIKRDAALTNARADAILKQIRMPEHVWIDIEKLIKSVLGRISDRRPESIAAPDIDIAQGLPLVWMDHEQLDGIIENMIINAYEAIASNLEQVELGRVRVAVRVRDDGLVHVVVQDNGPGINEYVRSRLLDWPVTSKDIDGHKGVGLWLGRRILRMAGGDIVLPDVEPDGRGATVVLLLSPVKQT